MSLLPQSGEFGDGVAHDVFEDDVEDAEDVLGDVVGVVDGGDDDEQAMEPMCLDSEAKGCEPMQKLVSNLKIEGFPLL